MTIPRHTVDRVLNLLDQGFTHRAIAARLHGLVKRATIDNIARRRDTIRSPVLPCLSSDDEPRAIRKCPACNHYVEMPCKICLARAYRRDYSALQRKYGLEPFDSS